MITLRRAEEVSPGRHAWIQVARGELTLDGQTLRAGDGASTSDPGLLSVAAGAGEAELLLLDLP